MMGTLRFTHPTYTFYSVSRGIRLFQVTLIRRLFPGKLTGFPAVLGDFLAENPANRQKNLFISKE